MAAFRVSVVAALALVSLVAATPRFIGEFPAKHAAFLNVETTTRGQPANLVISSFTGNPLAQGNVAVVPDIAKALGDMSSAAPTTLESITWPNLVHAVPDDAVPGFTGYVVANGFLVPGKSVGGITLFQTNAAGTEVTKTAKVSTDKGNKLFNGWFYHMAMWKDMNGDGRKDIVTARATKPIVGKEGSEFLWLEQPASDPLGGPWVEHSIASGPPSLSPGVFFEAYDIDGDGHDEFLSASFFGGGGFGIVYSNSTGAERWEAANVGVASIDTGLPLVNGFALQVTDINGDGKMDVLYTNHVNNATTKGAVSMVLAYEIPVAPVPFTDPSNWKRHVLTSGFLVREAGGSTQAAPGFAVAFHPHVHDTGKPTIVVGGDGDQRFYELAPLSPDPSNWSYNRTLIYDCKGTTASIVAADVNGDGYTEIVSGCYDSGKVFAFSYRT